MYQENVIWGSGLRCFSCILVHDKVSLFDRLDPWADPGGPDPPFWAHVVLVGFLTLGLKLDPPLLAPLFLLVNLRWTPLFKNPGSAPETPTYFSLGSTVVLASSVIMAGNTSCPPLPMSAPPHDRPSPTCTPSHEFRSWPPTLEGRADNLAQHCRSIGRPFSGPSHSVDKSAGS